MSYSAPIFSYISDGFQQSATLTTSATVYSLDSSTSWSITNELSRLNVNRKMDDKPNDIWKQSFGGSDQFHVLPSILRHVCLHGCRRWERVHCSYNYGSSVWFEDLSVSSEQKAWVDATSEYSYTNPLAGSTQSERWQAGNSSSTGRISSSAPISPIYYHQYAVSAGFTITNGGSPPAGPTFTSESFGATYSSALEGAQASYWPDAGSNYNVSSVIISSQERWIANSSTAGTVTSQLSLNFIYDHQYYLTMQGPQTGGTVNPSSEWVNEGNSISISNMASQGWKFEFWTGSGVGSYSGNTNSTTINVQAPITENATFYVGLTISTPSDGSVSYSYGNSSSIQVSAQAEVYVPLGTSVTLNANPSSFLYKLNSWGGAATGSAPQTKVMVDSPLTVEVQFGYNFVNIGAIIAVIIIAVIGIAVVMKRRKSSRKNLT